MDTTAAFTGGIYKVYAGYTKFMRERDAGSASKTAGYTTVYAGASCRFHTKSAGYTTIYAGASCRFCIKIAGYTTVCAGYPIIAAGYLEDVRHLQAAFAYKMRDIHQFRGRNGQVLYYKMRELQAKARDMKCNGS